MIHIIFLSLKEKLFNIVKILILFSMHSMLFLQSSNYDFMLKNFSVVLASLTYMETQLFIYYMYFVNF